MIVGGFQTRCEDIPPTRSERHRERDTLALTFAATLTSLALLRPPQEGKRETKLPGNYADSREWPPSPRPLFCVKITLMCYMWNETARFLQVQTCGVWIFTIFVKSRAVDCGLWIVDWSYPTVLIVISFYLVGSSLRIKHFVWFRGFQMFDEEALFDFLLFSSFWI